MFHPKIYKLLYYVVYDEVPSSSSQVVHQIEVIQEVVLPGVSKLNDSSLDREKETKHNFLQKKTLEKRIITPINRSHYRAIDPSILQEYFFICLNMFIL